MNKIGYQKSELAATPVHLNERLLILLKEYKTSMASTEIKLRVDFHVCSWNKFQISTPAWIENKFKRIFLNFPLPGNCLSEFLFAYTSVSNKLKSFKILAKMLWTSIFNMMLTIPNELVGIKLCDKPDPQSSPLYFDLVRALCCHTCYRLVLNVSRLQPKTEHCHKVEHEHLWSIHLNDKWL